MVKLSETAEKIFLGKHVFVSTETTKVQAQPDSASATIQEAEITSLYVILIVLLLFESCF